MSSDESFNWQVPVSTLLSPAPRSWSSATDSKTRSPWTAAVAGGAARRSSSTTPHVHRPPRRGHHRVEDGPPILV